MTFRPGVPAMTRCAIALCGASLCISALAQSGSAAFPKDNNRLDGDHLRLRTNVYGFTESGSTEASRTNKCAPVGTGLAVREELADGLLVVRFYDIPGKPDDETTPEALAACPEASRVNAYTAYTIQKSKLATFDFKRSGVAFGGLVVPFKFRLGGDNGVVSSSTVCQSEVSGSSLVSPSCGSVPAAPRRDSQGVAARCPTETSRRGPSRYPLKPRHPALAEKLNLC